MVNWHPFGSIWHPLEGPGSDVCTCHFWKPPRIPRSDNREAGESLRHFSGPGQQRCRSLREWAWFTVPIAGFDDTYKMGPKTVIGVVTRFIGVKKDKLPIYFRPSCWVFADVEAEEVNPNLKEPIQRPQKARETCACCRRCPHPRTWWACRRSLGTVPSASRRLQDGKKRWHCLWHQKCNRYNHATDSSHMATRSLDPCFGWEPYSRCRAILTGWLLLIWRLRQRKWRGGNCQVLISQGLLRFTSNWQWAMQLDTW